MKYFFFCVLLLFASGYGYCEEFFWKWDLCSSQCWFQYFSDKNKGEDIPCRELKSKDIGFVKKSTGECFLLGAKEAVDVYQIVNNTVPKYFRWVGNDYSSCYSALHSLTEPGLEGTPDNCVVFGRRLCRFQKNQSWTLGIESSSECVDPENNRSREYEFYAYDHFRYQILSSKDAVLVVGLLASMLAYLSSFWFSGFD